MRHGSRGEEESDEALVSKQSAGTRNVGGTRVGRSGRYDRGVRQSSEFSVSKKRAGKCSWNVEECW